MRHHRNKIALELTQFLFALEGFAQLFLGALALGDVHRHGKDVRGVVQSDRFGREQDGESLAPAISPATLSLANRT